MRLFATFAILTDNGRVFSVYPPLRLERESRSRREFPALIRLHPNTFCFSVMNGILDRSLPAMSHLHSRLHAASSHLQLAFLKRETLVPVPVPIPMVVPLPAAVPGEDVQRPERRWHDR